PEYTDQTGPDLLELAETEVRTVAGQHGAQDIECYWIRAMHALGDIAHMIRLVIVFRVPLRGGLSISQNIGVRVGTNNEPPSGDHLPPSFEPEHVAYDILNTLNGLGRYHLTELERWGPA